MFPHKLQSWAHCVALPFKVKAGFTCFSPLSSGWWKCLWRIFWWWKCFCKLKWWWSSSWRWICSNIHNVVENISGNYNDDGRSPGISVFKYLWQMWWQFSNDQAFSGKISTVQIIFRLATSVSRYCAIQQLPSPLPTHRKLLLSAKNEIRKFSSESLLKYFDVYSDCLLCGG